MAQENDNETDEQTAALKRRLLDRSGELFYQFGFKRVTMDDVAHALGISKKTLYQLTEGKDALVELFVDDLVERIIQQAAQFFAVKLDPIQLTRNFFSFMSKRFQMISPAMMLDLQRHWPHLWNRVNERRMNVLRAYLEVIEHNQDNGILRPEVNTKLMVRMVQAVVSEIVNPKTLIELEVTPQEAIRTLITVLLYGALTDEAREKYKED